MAQPGGRNEPLFGVSVEPNAERAAEISEIARITDRHRLDLLAVPNHRLSAKTSRCLDIAGCSGNINQPQVGHAQCDQHWLENSQLI